MTHGKCQTCYNRIHRLDLCMTCKWLFEEMKNEVLEDEYKPMICNPRKEI